MEFYQGWVQDEIAPFSNLKYKSIEYTIINEKELIIETKAATLNFADLLLSSGMYQSNPKTPFVPGFEVAGNVKECSADSKFAVGDSVNIDFSADNAGNSAPDGDYRVATVIDKDTFTVTDSTSLTGMNLIDDPTDPACVLKPLTEAF